MAERKKRMLTAGGFILILVAFLALDIILSKQGNESRVEAVTVRPATKATVAVVASTDKELKNRAPLDAEKVSSETVDEAVRRALDLDTSETSIRNVIAPSDWVLVKINMVCAPLKDNDGKRENRNFYLHGYEHWGDTTDARVVKSVVNYLIEKVGPKRITLVEGSGTWAVAGKRSQGKQYAGTSFDVDGWTVHWREFGDICYKDMVEEFNSAQSRTKVDIQDLNEDKYRFEPVPGGAFQREGGKFRDAKKYGQMAVIPGSGKPREGYYMPETMLSADKLVNIPAYKMNTGGATLIFKNYVGGFSSFPYGDGTAKSQMDRYGYCQGMLDIYSYRPTNYAVIAGFWASERDWPSHTENLHHNVVVAGGRPVETEAVALRIMGVNPADVIWTYLAEQKGFGSFDEKNITVVGHQPNDLRRNWKKHSRFQGIGFQNYLMCGPFTETDLDTDLLGGEAKIQPREGDTANGKSWWVFKHPFGLPEAYVSLNENLSDDLTNSITYAYLCLNSVKKQSGTFRFGYDDGAKVFLNGKVIYRDDGPHEFQIREKEVKVTLNKGDNHLLIKLKNRRGEAGFAATIEDDSATMLYGLEIVVPKDRGMQVAGK
jgi:hypothetical protein